MKIHIPNSVWLGNIDPFLQGFDPSSPKQLQLTFNKKWMSVHPMVLSMIASLGLKIDKLLVEIIEAIAIASFLSPTERQPWVKLAIRKTDTLKIFLIILWETKSLDTKKYISLSEKIDEIGRMLGGWNGQLTKQNSPK